MLGFLKKEREREKNLENNAEDLGKRTRRKKKELPKPWGKKERFLIIGILLFTIISSGALALYARNWKLPGFPRLSFPKFSFFEGETIVIEGNRVSKTHYDQSQAIISEFETKTKSYSGVYSLYVYDLTENFGFGVNEKDQMQAASLIKLPAMIAMYMQDQDKSLSLSDKYRLKNEDKVAGAGSLFSKPEGYEVTYRDLIRLMGKQSDNTAFRVVENILGEERIKGVITEIGMNDTDFDDNQTTPEDIGLLFKKLYQGDLINNKSKEELLGFLTDTVYEEWLVAGIPGDIEVAHKYGREVHVVNDVGIVFSDGPFVVVIMAEGVVEREADEIFPELSKIVYEGMSN